MPVSVRAEISTLLYIMDYYDDENKDMNKPTLKKPCVCKEPGYISLEGRRIIEIESLAKEL